MVATNFTILSRFSHGPHRALGHLSKCGFSRLQKITTCNLAWHGWLTQSGPSSACVQATNTDLWQCCYYQLMSVIEQLCPPAAGLDCPPDSRRAAAKAPASTLAHTVWLSYVPDRHTLAPMPCSCIRIKPAPHTRQAVWRDAMQVRASLLVGDHSNTKPTRPATPPIHSIKTIQAQHHEQ